MVGFEPTCTRIQGEPVTRLPVHPVSSVQYRHMYIKSKYNFTSLLRTLTPPTVQALESNGYLAPLLQLRGGSVI